jgi:N-ethylmaleimide reductase
MKQKMLQRSFELYVERFRNNTELAIPDPETFYQGGDAGYIDYPAIYSNHTSRCAVL